MSKIRIKLINEFNNKFISVETTNNATLIRSKLKGTIKLMRGRFDILCEKANYKMGAACYDEREVNRGCVCVKKASLSVIFAYIKMR